MWRKLLLIVLSTAASILAVEALARLLGVQAKFAPLALSGSVAMRSIDGVVLWRERYPRFDEDDLRRAAADDDGFTILGLGDSILYGVGQPREGTYLERARQALAERSPRRVNILNLTVPGYNTMQENALYKEVEE